MEDIDRLQPNDINPDSTPGAQAVMRAQQQRSEDEEFSSENADVSHPQDTDNASEANREPNMDKAQEMARAEDPYQEVITNVKNMIAKGGMTEKAAQRIIENQTKRAEKASNKSGEDYESKEQQKARWDEELQVASGDLALQITDAIGLKETGLSLSVEDHQFKAPESLFKKAHYTIPKEEIFKKSLDLLGIKPEQVQEVIRGMSAGDINASSSANSDNDQDEIGEPRTTEKSRIERPDGSLLDFVYTRGQYSYAPGSAGSGFDEAANRPSSLSINIGTNGRVLTGDSFFDDL
jgi:hypothetical protein